MKRVSRSALQKIDRALAAGWNRIREDHGPCRWLRTRGRKKKGAK